MSDEPSESLPKRSLKAERSLLSSSAIRALAEEPWNRPRLWVDAVVLFLFVVLMTTLFAPIGSSNLPVPGAESIASKTIRAQRNVVIEDREATALRREQAVSGVREQFLFDPDLMFERRDRLAEALDALFERRAADETSIADRRAAFEADLGLPVNGRIFELLEGLPNADDASAALTFFINTASDRMIVADRALLPEQGGIDLRRPGDDRVRPIFYLGGIIDVAQAWRLMRARAREAPYGEARLLRTWLLETALAAIEPNLQPDQLATDAMRTAAHDGVEPVMVRISRGEVLVREGDRVTAQIQSRLRALNDASEGSLAWVDSVAFAGLLAGLVALGAYFFRRGREPLKLTRKSGYITLAGLVVTSVACLAALYAGRGIAEGFGIDPRMAAYLCPVALSTALIALIVNARTSLMVGVALSLLVSYRADGGIWLTAYYLIGVLVAGIVARRCRHRSDLLKVGVVIAIAQAVAAPATFNLGGGGLGLDYLSAPLFALVSGGLVALLAMGLLPLFEYLFEEVTDVRLMELASGDHKLLRRLALHSPGTYHHSVMIANLAEAAAQAIGANALQNRVMALYHDIGKSVRPVYFAENQREGNIHDGLPPELSARIIFAHITDGIELARQHRLGRPVINAITQHQGTTLLRTFYLKAREQAEHTGAAVNEEDFRYPGPKPRTRESGIMMLADSVEAATRALKNPSPADVKQRVNEVIQDKITDGQLSDCALTIADISAIQEAFTRVLVLGVYHSRIEYPAMKKGSRGHWGRRDNADRDNDSGSPLSVVEPASRR